ncbi:MAG: outer membrane beta-barrel protein [Bdellovibrionota bacterium]
MRRLKAQSFIILIFALILVGTASAANAGIMEISYTYSTRNSFIDDDNFQKSFSHTGSFAWYFIEQSAIELSYTKGEGEVSGKAASDAGPVKYTTQFEMYDASLILTFGGKTSFFQPYIKGGAAWIDKTIYRDNPITKGEKISSTDKSDPVPSYGVGFRLFITQNISFKASYDTWKAGESGSDERWDDAVRGGVSVMF